MRRLLILTSGFPRWPGDSTTPFVAQFASIMARRHRSVLVSAPHFRGARLEETYGDGVQVRRFRYFLPSGAQDIAYGGNAVRRVSRTPLYAVKLVCFMLSALVSVLVRRADIVNAHWLIPQGFVAVVAKALTGTRVVVTVHGGDVFSLNGRLMRRVKRFVLERADAVVVNSTATRQACTELYAGRDYDVIPMGIDTDRFTPGDRSPELVRRHALGDLFTVLFVGRLTADKGVLDLLRALEGLKAAGAEFRALVIGDGDQAPELQKYVVESDLQGEVHLPGWVDSADLPAYYRTADVFVGPSVVGETGWQEALGLVFVEALATGIPVIATDTGGIGDVVEHGVTGFLVEQCSPEQILERLQQLRRDPELRSELGRKGRALVEERYSWPAVGDRYEAVFASLDSR
jgi:glycosyltransferase involved in cell wall biosynthesis